MLSDSYSNSLSLTVDKTLTVEVARKDYIVVGWGNLLVQLQIQHIYPPKYVKYKTQVKKILGIPL